MEFTAKNNIKVGIFLFVGLAITLSSIFLLGADKSLFTRHTHIFAHFEQVQGLDRGSVVSLSGVTIGNIETIKFVSEKNLLKVDMRIENAFMDRIPKGSQVEIRTQGALGDKFIYVIPGDPKAGPISAGENLEVAKATDIFNIVSERGKETEKIFDIINEIYVLTKTLNSENKIGKIVDNLSQASTDFRAVSKETKSILSAADLGSTTAKLKTSVDKIDSIISKVDKGQGTLGALINDPSVHEQLKAFLGGTQRKNHIRSVIRTSIEKSEGN